MAASAGKRWRVSTAVIGIALAAALASAATAADLAPVTPPASVSATPAPAQDGWNLWTITIGGIGIVEPLYPGASRYGPSGMPILDFRRAGTPEEFSAPEDSFGFAVIDTPWVKLGPVVALRGGRFASIDRRLRGLKTWPYTVEGGAFLEVWPVPGTLRTRLELRHGLRGNDGFIANLSADAVHRIGRFTLSGGPRLAFADTPLSALEFGVTPAEAALNGLVTPFRAHGGLQSIGVGAALSYRWSPHWTSIVYADYARLVGSAADSPITRRLGSANQFTAGIGLAYSFDTRLPF
jgi:outer membrane scaffolding protein for murein synthesis (MipA/OmpV family)